MKRLILSYLFGTLVCTQALAHTAAACEAPMSLDNFTALVHEVKGRFFPELKTINVGVATFRSDAYFLQAQPVVVSLLGRKKNRRYNVQLNLKLLECPPTIEALEAILVHELEHVVDYLPMSATKIASHGLHYIMSKKFHRFYERSTDCKVLDRGLHHGLIEYRNWVYQWLNPRELQTKRKIYLTPEEIKAFEVSGKCSVDSNT